MNAPESTTRVMAASIAPRRGASGVLVSKRGTGIGRRGYGKRRPRLALQQLQVAPGHQADELLEARLRRPPQLALGLRVVADEVVDLSWSHERLIGLDVLLPVRHAG